MLTIAEILHGKTHKLIEDQIAVYISYGKRTGSIKRSHKDWIKLFARHCQKDDIWDVEKEDIDKFSIYIRQKYSAQYLILEAEIAVRGIMKFYQARSLGRKKYFSPGRPKSVTVDKTYIG